MVATSTIASPSSDAYDNGADTTRSLTPEPATGVSPSIYGVREEGGVFAVNESLAAESNTSTKIMDMLTEYVEHDAKVPGWKWSSISWTWYLILQLISAIVGFLGNLLVIAVIFQRRSSGRSTDLLIGSLAIADFITSIFVIPYPKASQIPNTWQGMLYCLVVFPEIFFWTTVTASSYILMAISIERYIAIIHPLHFNRIVTVRRVNIVIALAWLLGLLSLAFSFFIIKVDETSGACTMTVTSPEGLAAIGYFWFILRIFVPTATMLVTQSLIAIQLHRQHAIFKANKSSTNTSFHLIARNRVLRMMFEIILIYIICWTPNQTAFLGYLVGFVPPSYISSMLHHVLTLLGFYNSCANPVIYTARHPQFRDAVKELFMRSAEKNTPVFGQNATCTSRIRSSKGSNKTTVFVSNLSISCITNKSKRGT